MHRCALSKGLYSTRSILLYQIGGKRYAPLLSRYVKCGMPVPSSTDMTEYPGWLSRPGLGHDCMDMRSVGLVCEVCPIES
jgi:hypothetical protein